MEKHLYYHFWMLKDTEMPFDIEKEYCYLQDANDKKFIANYMVSREYLSYLFENEHLPELLNIYLNVIYDENHPENIKTKAIDWISHTIEILLEADIFFNFINLKILEHIVKDFKPSNKINILKLDEKKIPQRMSLDRSDPFFTLFITVSFNIDFKKHKAQEKIEDEVDDEIKYAPKIRIDYNVRTALLILILKKINITRNEKDVTKICRLISMLTGQSYNSLYQDLIAGIQLLDKNKKSITEMNSILNDLDIDFKLIKGEEYKLWKDKIK
ncbi:MAG: hypothetical protein ACOYMA_18630 [Bacteroidia bacterium]